MGKLIMLASLLAKLEGPEKDAFIGELTELIDAKTGGLGFKISEKDITKTLTDSDKDQEDKSQEEKDSVRFKEGLKKYTDGTLEGMKANGVNIQEM